MKKTNFLHTAILVNLKKNSQNKFTKQNIVAYQHLEIDLVNLLKSLDFSLSLSLSLLFYNSSIVYKHNGAGFQEQWNSLLKIIMRWSRWYKKFTAKDLLSFHLSSDLTFDDWPTKMELLINKEKRENYITFLINYYIYFYYNKVF